MVFASTPVASVMRFAARPVGAQSNSDTPLAARILRIELTIVVLPTPGPPVITSTFAVSARRIAALGCQRGAYRFASRSKVRPSLRQSMARVACRSQCGISRSAIACSAR